MMSKENKLAEINAITKEHISSAIHCELQFAQTKFKPMNSAHEGYATLLEEYEELTDEIKFIQEGLEDLWFFVKKNNVQKIKLCIDLLSKRRENLIHEAVQVGAMLERFNHDVCGSIL